MCRTMDDSLGELKKRVSIEAVLDAYGALSTLRARGPHRLVGPCPIHPNADNPNAFVVDRTNNLWYCFSRCNRGGDLVELVRALGNLSYPQTRRFLARIASLHPGPDAGHAQNLLPNHHFQPYTRALRLQASHPFFGKLSLKPSTLHDFQAGFYPHSRGFLAGSLGVRLHDTNGCPWGYAARRLRSTEIASYGKWKFPHRLPKSRLLYNWHRIRKALPAPIIVTEGPWAVMKLHQTGLSNAVALLGLQMSPFQKSLLVESNCPIIILLDADPPGISASKNIARSLGARATPVHLPPDTDPDDLPENQLAAIIKPLLQKLHSS